MKTKEGEIIDFIKESGKSTTNKTICDKFNVTEDYIKSLKFRIKKNG